MVIRLKWRLSKLDENNPDFWSDGGNWDVWNQGKTIDCLERKEGSQWQVVFQATRHYGWTRNFFVFHLYRCKPSATCWIAQTVINSISTHRTKRMENTKEKQGNWLHNCNKQKNSCRPKSSPVANAELCSFGRISWWHTNRLVMIPTSKRKGKWKMTPVPYM